MQIQLIVTSPNANADGFNWTIYSRLGHALSAAEEMFGRRDIEWTILGVEFANIPQPQVWFPRNCKHVLIQLTRNALDDVGRAIFQMSHEVVHCLTPTGSKGANVLEEGLATLFSEKYIRDENLGDWHADTPEYSSARDLALRLLEMDINIIKNVRQRVRTISLITPNDLMDANNSIDINFAERLCAPFSM